VNRNEKLIKIEDLMLDICSGRYHWRDAITELEEYRKLAFDIYDSELEYSPMLQGYFDLMSINSLNPVRARLATRSNQPLFRSKTDFMGFCDDLMSQHDQFINRQKRKRNRNATVLEKRFEKLVEDHCKLLLVRVDLSYRYDADTSIRDFDANLEVLRRRIQNRDTCFKGVLDYSWAIEQGRDKGSHCHILLIYNGSKYMKDEYYAMQLGKVWQDITDGEGCYFNCNSKAHKDQYRKQNTLGIGMIHRSNALEVSRAFKAISYLARADKEDQHLRAKIRGKRGFG